MSVLAISSPSTGTALPTVVRCPAWRDVKLASGRTRKERCSKVAAHASDHYHRGHSWPNPLPASEPEALTASQPTTEADSARLELAETIIEE
jgi:hypothetical protein